MALFNLSELRAALPAGLRLMGIDPGSRIIGLALSDVEVSVASPYGSLRRDKLAAVATEIRTIADRERVGALVIGLPLSMDGTFGPAAQAAKDWALALSDASAIPAAMWDERLSSAAANRFLVGRADLSRAKRAASVDRLAAAIMLQGALDATRPDPQP